MAENVKVIVRCRPKNKKEETVDAKVRRKQHPPPC